MQCIGRFTVTSPQGWDVAGRAQKAYTSYLEDDLQRAVRNGAAESDPVLKILRGESPSLRPVIKRFTLGNVGPAAWFGFGDVNSVRRELVVLAGSPQSGLRLTAQATAGRENNSEQGLTLLAAGYRPGLRTGFCLSKGSIILEPSRNESTNITFTASSIPEASIQFNTQATTSPRSNGPLTDIPGDIAAMRGTDTILKSLVSRSRSIAGMTGHEGRVEMNEPGKPPTQIYKFFFPGIARDATSPEIIISLEGPSSHRNELESAWESLLNSLQKVPTK